VCQTQVEVLQQGKATQVSNDAVTQIKPTQAEVLQSCEATQLGETAVYHTYTST
jgi:hypothetical protein